jgi:carboxymethylenebutenolidase
VVVGEGSGAACPAHAAVPRGATRGVVILHEILGRQPEIDRVVTRFARAGYAACAPDLFARGSRLACIRRLFEESARGEGPATDMVGAARAWLCEHAGIPRERVGLVGLCITGGFVLAIGRGWGAVSSNYGGVPDAALVRGIGPVIGCYGGRDRVFGRMGERLRAALEGTGTPVETHVFPTVGHSFLTDGDHPVLEVLTRPFFHARHDADVAEEAWGKILAFFERHLGS